MSIEVRRATESDREQWNKYVARSPQGTLFHEYEALDIQARHSDATVHPLIGYKGQESVGLFAIFEITKGLVTTAFSPPPDLRIPYLGPAYLNMAKLKQRKRERRRQRFLEQCYDWIETELTPKYEHVRTGTKFRDPRPFKWNEYDVVPEHTYTVDLSLDRDDLLMTFSSDARNNIRKTSADRYHIEKGRKESLSEILTQVSNRYESQGLSFHLADEFVTDLYEGTEHGAIRPYTLNVDDEFIGGILAFESNDTLFRWQGGVRTDTDVDLPTNDLLDWAVMTDGIERGISTYDLVGADNQRINRYKAKFNPSLETYYIIERGNWGIKKFAHLYNSIK
jgi:hypothetical protein